MGFFFTDEDRSKKKDKNLTIAASLGCKVCPRNELKIFHGKMLPTGTKTPVIYVLGEYPGRTEDFDNVHFSGESEKILMEAFTDVFEDTDCKAFIRLNNVVRCFSKSEKPSPFEVECCKEFLIKDIETTKPIAIFGFGETPLKAIVSGKMIGMWRGRKIPVKVGVHICWYFPFHSPSFIAKTKPKNSNNEFGECFKSDIRRATDFLFGVEDYYKPTIIESGYRDGVVILKDKIKEFLEAYNEPMYAIDIETTTLKPVDIGAKLLTISIGTDKKVYAFPYTDDLKKPLFDLLCRKSAKIAHNLKFELEWFLHLFGGDQTFIRNSVWHDTMAQAYLLDERTSKDEGMLNLDRLTQLRYGFNLKEKSNVDRKNLVLSDETLYYNGMDSKYEYKLFIDQQKELQKEQGISCYNSIIKTAGTLAITESRGLVLDFEQINYLKTKYENRIKRLDTLISSLKEVATFKNRYGDFNPLSGENCILMFRDVYKLPQIKLTKGTKSKEGKYSVDNEVLTRFMGKEFGKVRLAKYVLMYRTYTKLQSTYLDNVIDNEIDGLLYANFNLYFTTTGRLSSGKGND